MKKWGYLSLLAMLCLMFVACAQESSSSTYNDYVSDFKAVSVSEATQMIDNNDKFILFVGNEHCKDCQEFMPTLHEIYEEKQLTIYYIDSSQAETDVDISEFMKEQQINWVPTIVIQNENGLSKPNLSIDKDKLTKLLLSTSN